MAMDDCEIVALVERQLVGLTKIDGAVYLCDKYSTQQVRFIISSEDPLDEDIIEAIESAGEEMQRRIEERKIEKEAH